MAEVVLFHHVQGLTDGVRDFAARLAGQEHTVHTPDLYGGAIAATLEEGFAIKNDIGDDSLTSRVDQTLKALGSELVYAGISLGVMTAQRLAQTRPGALGALLYEACVPTTGNWAFGPWPELLPVQVHGMDDDEFFAHEGDLEAARNLVASLPPGLGKLHTYHGSSHLFVDSSLPSYDAGATAIVLDRSRAMLDRLS